MTNLEKFACDILMRAHRGLDLKKNGQRTDGPEWSPATCKDITRLGERHGIQLSSLNSQGKDDA